MVFNSTTFLIFAGFFFPVYFLLQSKIRVFFVLCSSYFFYAWWDWRFLSLICLSTTIDYFVGYKLGIIINARYRKFLLLFSILSNLSILATFKYLGFFAESFEEFLLLFNIQPDWPTLNLILPVGISFYTFQSLSYTIDIYRKRLNPERNIIYFASYVALFPQLVAGPIVRASHLLPQLRHSVFFDYKKFFYGFELIVWGFFLKLVLADNIGMAIDLGHRFVYPQSFGAPELTSAVFLFAFQIYGDFAGYSLIAIGLAKIMGLDLEPNFKRPYFSASFSEYWQRWHISLSSWLRDYIYYPLEVRGQRNIILRKVMNGRPITYANIFITMFLSGLWHGAAWTFIFWGLLHGMYLVFWDFFQVVSKKFSTRYNYKVILLLKKIFLVLIVFILTLFAYILFRSESLNDALHIIKTILTWQQTSFSIEINRSVIVKSYTAIFVVLVVDMCCENKKIYNYFRKSFFLRVSGILISLWSIALFGNFSGGEFIYFQF